jgi:hypothetical protein
MGSTGRSHDETTRRTRQVSDRSALACKEQASQDQDQRVLDQVPGDHDAQRNLPRVPEERQGGDPRQLINPDGSR